MQFTCHVRLLTLHVKFIRNCNVTPEIIKNKCASINRKPEKNAI